MPEKLIHEQAITQCEQKREVEANELLHPRNKLAESQDMGIVSDGRRLHDRIERALEVILRQITAKRRGDEVKHASVDNFMRAKLRFQDSGNAAPDRTCCDCGDKAER